MSLYFLNYDLRNQKDYQALYEELDNFRAVRVLESCWCFEYSNTNAKSLRNHFTRFIDKDDGLIVSEVISWASIRTQGSPNLLQKNVL